MTPGSVRKDMMKVHNQTPQTMTEISSDSLQSPFKSILNSFLLTEKGQSMTSQMLPHGVLNDTNEARFFSEDKT